MRIFGCDVTGCERDQYHATMQFGLHSEVHGQLLQGLRSMDCDGTVFRGICHRPHQTQKRRPH